MGGANHRWRGTLCLSNASFKTIKTKESTFDIETVYPLHMAKEKNYPVDSTDCVCIIFSDIAHENDCRF